MTPIKCVCGKEFNFVGVYNAHKHLDNCMGQDNKSNSSKGAWNLDNMPKQTMTRRFYKTHSAIQRPQILELYSEAVASASKCIEAGDKEEYYIVEVVAVVRRQKPVVNPIVVEEITKG